MNETDDGHPWLWAGTCTCGSEFTIAENALMATYPQLADSLAADGAFTVDCPDCTKLVTVERTNAQVVPFSAWNILPPENGCPECGVEHEPELPHNLQSLSYQYRFRLQQVQIGAQERWPTWWDAMRHCSDETRQSWVVALGEHGVLMGPDLADT